MRCSPATKIGEVAAVPVDPDECRTRQLSSFKSCHEASKRYGEACDFIKSAIEGTCLQDMDGSNFCKLLAIDRRTSEYRSALTSTCWSRPRLRIAGLRGEMKMVYKVEFVKNGGRLVAIDINIPSIHI